MGIVARAAEAERWRESGEVRAIASNTELLEVHQVHLVDRDDHVRDAEQMRERRVAARLARDAVTRVDQQDHAASAVLAPVTMLRVYCSWPGVSAMMNLRARVAK